MNYDLIEKLAVQSLVGHKGELIFSKEKFAELIIRECARIANEKEENFLQYDSTISVHWYILTYFGIKSDAGFN